MDSDLSLRLLSRRPFGNELRQACRNGSVPELTRLLNMRQFDSLDLALALVDLCAYSGRGDYDQRLLPGHPDVMEVLLVSGKEELIHHLHALEENRPLLSLVLRNAYTSNEIKRSVFSLLFKYKFSVQAAFRIFFGGRILSSVPAYFYPHQNFEAISWLLEDGHMSHDDLVQYLGQCNLSDIREEHGARLFIIEKLIDSWWLNLLRGCPTSSNGIFERHKRRQAKEVILTVILSLGRLARKGLAPNLPEEMVRRILTDADLGRHVFLKDCLLVTPVDSSWQVVSAAHVRRHAPMQPTFASRVRVFLNASYSRIENKMTVLYFISHTESGACHDVTMALSSVVCEATMRCMSVVSPVDFLQLMVVMMLECESHDVWPFVANTVCQMMLAVCQVLPLDVTLLRNGQKWCDMRFVRIWPHFVPNMQDSRSYPKYVLAALGSNGLFSNSASENQLVVADEVQGAVVPDID